MRSRLPGALLALLTALGCAVGGGPFGRSDALRLSELGGDDDPTRRASLRLCVKIFFLPFVPACLSAFVP